MASDPLAFGSSFPAVADPGRRLPYHPRLAALRNRDASGVYVIFDARTREPLYVGESHSGRLYDTITRHFRAWSIDPDTDEQGRRRGGTTYHRQAVRVAVQVTPADRAEDEQYAAIAWIDPSDNKITGETLIDEIADLPPF